MDHCLIFRRPYGSCTVSGLRTWPSGDGAESEQVVDESGVTQPFESIVRGQARGIWSLLTRSGWSPPLRSNIFRGCSRLARMSMLHFLPPLRGGCAAPAWHLKHLMTFPLPSQWVIKHLVSAYATSPRPQLVPRLPRILWMNIDHEEPTHRSALPAEKLFGIE